MCTKPSAPTTPSSPPSKCCGTRLAAFCGGSRTSSTHHLRTPCEPEPAFRCCGTPAAAFRRCSRTTRTLHTCAPCGREPAFRRVAEPRPPRSAEAHVPGVRIASARLAAENPLLEELRNPARRVPQALTKMGPERRNSEPQEREASVGRADRPLGLGTGGSRSPTGEGGSSGSFEAVGLVAVSLRHRFLLTIPTIPALT